MVIRELTHPTPEEYRRTVQVLTDAFWKTPFFTQYLFRGRKPLAKAFLEAQLLYALKVGRVFVASDDQAGIIACALWSLPTSLEFNLKTILRLGLAPKMAGIALRSPAAAFRMRELFAMLERYAPETPCACLEFLSSVRPGVGSALLKECMKAFPGLPLYVESIVSKNDHAYYRQFGFVPFARTDFHGTDYSFMLTAPQAEAK